MIEKLAELNRVLLAVSELADADRTASIEAVVAHCKETVIEARIPNHETTIAFAAQTGFLDMQGNDAQLTDDGVRFLELNPTRQYDLSEEQKKVLLRTCYLHGAQREEARAILKEFAPGLEGDGLHWSPFDSSPLPNELTAEHLGQLGLIHRHEDGWKVNGDYLQTVSTFLDEGAGWSEEQFKQYLKEKEEVGKLGEDLVKEFEAQRLLGLGHTVEARCVRRISHIRVNAGYDLESFDAASPNITYDRFIEVKGAKGPQLRFFWSENEMNVATKLGKQYWIYFQGSIDVAKKRCLHEPIMLNDPINTILPDASFAKTPQGLIVQSNLKGKLKI
jgi:hypothetical protein